jgi:predicted alpha/beta superfamily hydrolase
MKAHLFSRTGKQIFLLTSFFLATLPGVVSQDKPKPQAENFPTATIPDTEFRTFYSAILNQEMNLYIKLPVSYYTNPQKIYQGWYITDANRTFPMVANMVSLYEVPTIAEPEIVVIGIGYKIKDMGDWAAWRTRDLTPTSVPAVDSGWAKTLFKITGRQYEVNTGGAGIFLDFIVRELFPFIESNYRVSSENRGIGGYSYGGLFSLYVLFRQPELFNIYYAGSPAIGHDKGVIYNFEKEYASSHKDLNAKLFMSTGGSEDSLMISNMKKMAVLLQSRNYSGLTVDTHVFPGETHQSCIPSSVMRALRVLYKR